MGGSPAVPDYSLTGNELLGTAIRERLGATRPDFTDALPTYPGVRL